MNCSVITRVVGLDIIRSCAIFFVIAGHFFINTDFGKDSFGGWEMVLLAAGRRLFSISVPLFLIITGYLNINKKLSKEYYYGGIKVLVSYIVISLVTILFLIYHNHVDLTVKQWVLSITGFTAISYGWYIEMWIGLFLLIPFLNILWHSLGVKRHKEILILTLFLLTALPNFVNRPSVQLLPDFWAFMYPILFFYIGSYIHEYQPIVRLKLALPSIVLLCMFNPLINILLLKSGGMTPGSPFGIMGVLIATVFFLAFYRTDIGNVFFRLVLAKISVYSLDMYLISYMFDLFYYQIFQAYYAPTDYLIAFVVITSCVFISSFVFAWCKDVVFRIPQLFKR